MCCFRRRRHFKTQRIKNIIENIIHICKKIQIKYYDIFKLYRQNIKLNIMIFLNYIMVLNYIQIDIYNILKKYLIKY